MSVHGSSDEKRVYYTAERGYYVPHPDSKTTFVVEKERPVCSPCLWILAVLFIIFIVVLVIVLVVLFTWGQLNTPVKPNSQELKGQEVHYDLQSPEWVNDALVKGNPKLCILDTALFNDDPDLAFQNEHLPGAVRFDINSIAKNTPTKRRELVSPLEFQAYARSLGINDSCYVLAYDHSDNARSIVTATYVWWVFKTFGHDKVSIMNGGLKAWKQRSFPVIHGTTDVTPGDLHVSWNSKSVLSFDDALALVEADNRANTYKTQILDVRNHDEFLGKSTQFDPKAGGHIVGAINFPTEKIIDPDSGTLKDLPECKRLLKEAHIDLEKSTLVYDNTGLQSSAVYFVLIQAGSQARLYDGGWVEWSYKAPANLTVTA